MDRRKFIYNSLGGVAWMTLMASGGGLVDGGQRKKLGVALLGLGNYSANLLAPALEQTEHCQLVGIVTGTPEKAAQWKKKYNLKDENIYNYDNFDQIAKNRQIDVVYVVTPPALHATYTIRAAKAGKHVWCEKPMAMNVQECEQMIKACKENKVSLCIGYRMQHEPNTKDIIEFARTKPYGEIQKVTADAGYYETKTDHWKLKKAMGGGATYDMGVYCINGSRYAMGKEPVAVKAVKSALRPELYTEVDETMNFELYFGDGTIAVCETSLGKNLNKLHVDCANGWYELAPFQSYGGIQGRTSDGKMLDKSIPNQQARQMDDDTLSIRKGQPVLVPGEEGLRDIRIVEAIFKSAASGGKKVTI